MTQWHTGGDTLLQTDHVGTWSSLVGIYGFGPLSVIQTFPRGLDCSSVCFTASLSGAGGRARFRAGSLVVQYRQTVSSGGDSGLELELWFVDVLTEWSMLLKWELYVSVRHEVKSMEHNTEEQWRIQMWLWLLSQLTLKDYHSHATIRNIYRSVGSCSTRWLTQ